MINYLDLFSGCGGFRRGIEEAGIKIGFEAHSEIDKYANSVYELHYPQSKGLGNVNDVRTDELPRINLITFGFPCQDLSIAGKRAGLDGQRSGLFYRAMQIVRELQPDYFIFENVKGLFSSNEGRDFEAVLREVANSGYDGQWQMLNTSWFLPQNRERVYFIGYPRAGGRPEVFPIGESYATNDRQGREMKSGLCPSIPARAREDGSGQPVVKVPFITNPKMNNYFPSSISVAITATAYKEPPIVSNIRRLTPKECERLQGFPDDWTRWGVGGEISDTQRYKMIGNAVSVPVVKAVVNKLFGEPA